MDITEFTKMLKDVIAKGWCQLGVDITPALMKKADNPQAVSKLYNQCKFVVRHNYLDMHDAIYHQLHRGKF